MQCSWLFNCTFASDYGNYNCEHILWKFLRSSESISRWVLSLYFRRFCHLYNVSYVVKMQDKSIDFLQFFSWFTYCFLFQNLFHIFSTSFRQVLTKFIEIKCAGWGVQTTYIDIPTPPVYPLHYLPFSMLQTNCCIQNTVQVNQMLHSINCHVWQCLSMTCL